FTTRRARADHRFYAPGRAGEHSRLSRTDRGPWGISDLRPKRPLPVSRRAGALPAAYVGRQTDRVLLVALPRLHRRAGRTRGAGFRAVLRRLQGPRPRIAVSGFDRAKGDRARPGSDPRLPTRLPRRP